MKGENRVNRIVSIHPSGSSRDLVAPISSLHCLACRIIPPTSPLPRLLKNVRSPFLQRLVYFLSLLSSLGASPSSPSFSRAGVIFCSMQKNMFHRSRRLAHPRNSPSPSALIELERPRGCVSRTHPAAAERRILRVSLLASCRGRRGRAGAKRIAALIHHSASPLLFLSCRLFSRIICHDSFRCSSSPPP